MRILVLIALLALLPLSGRTETVQLQVAASADDAHAYGSAGLLTSFAYPRFGQNSILEPYESAVRFVDVPLDSGVSIDSAFLELRAHTAWSADSIVYVVAAEDTADASAFSSRADYDLRLGNLTATSPAQIIYATTAGSWYRSPDISEMLEALVSRPDWRKDSSDMALFLRPTGDSPADTWFELYHFDADSTSAHRLYVYTSSGTPVVFSARRKRILSQSTLSGGQ